jgi:iron complex outermembrane recepter protein
VNFITRKPSGDLHVKGTATAGTDNLRGFKLGVDLPAIGTQDEGAGTLATSFGFQTRKRDDLYGNTNPDRSGFENIDRQAYRFAAQWNPRDTLSIDFTFDHSELDEHVAAGRVVGLTPLSVPGSSTGLANVGTNSPSRINTMQTLLGAVGRLPQTANTALLSSWLNNTINGYRNALSSGKGRPSKGSSDFDNYSTNDVDGHALTASWDLGDFGALGEINLKSISAYRELENENHGDLDGFDSRVNGGTINDLALITAASSLLNPATAAYGNSIVTRLANAYSASGFFTQSIAKNEQFSQEFQINGSAERVEYTVGLYYYEDESTWRNVPSAVFPISSTAPVDYDNETQAMAVFSQATWTPPVLDDRLSLTGGLRYTEEKKDITYLWRANPNGVYEFDLDGRGAIPIDPSVYGKKDHENFQNTSGALTIAYQLSDEINAFVRYATGYRSGGFNGDFYDLAADRGNLFDEETMEQWELGIKSDWWENRLRVNASIFQYKYKDLQISQVLEKANGSLGNGITNAGLADRWGAETEIVVSPIDDLLLSLSYTYISGDFDEFADNCAPAAGGGACNANPEKYAKRQQFPSNQVTFGVDYKLLQLENGFISAHIDGNWQDQWYSVAQSTAVYDTTSDRIADTPVLYENIPMDERLVVNARLSLEDVKAFDGVIRIAVWSKNLFEQDYRVNTTNLGNSLGSVVAMYGEPRTVGLDLTYEY